MADDLIFVYGTLRQGEINQGLMEGFVQMAGQARTAGLLWNTGNGYPALSEDDGSGSFVYGEVYRIPEGGLAALDILEDYHGPDDSRNEYERVRMPIQTDCGTLHAWAYIYKPSRLSGLPRIRSGDWKADRLLGHRNEPFTLIGESYYFAYGSCMDERRIRLDGADRHFRNEAGRGVARGYALQFTHRAADGGRADMIESGSGAVEGKLYRIGGEALAYLWRREGVDEGVYRPAFVRARSDLTGGDVEALTFVVVHKEEETAPPHWYLEEIVRGAAPVVSSEYFRQLKEQFRTRFAYEA